MLKKQVVNGKVRISVADDTDWVAKIDGFDSKYVFQRNLLQPKKGRKSDGYVYYDLEDGGIYEISEPREGVYFITVSGKQILELEKEEVKMLLEKQGKILSEKCFLVTPLDTTLYEISDNVVLLSLEPKPLVNKNNCNCYEVQTDKKYLDVQEIRHNSGKSRTLLFHLIDPLIGATVYSGMITGDFTVEGKTLTDIENKIVETQQREKEKEVRT